MKLMPKLIWPLLAVFFCIMGYFYGYWMPRYHEDAKKGYVAETSRHLESVAQGLVPLMLGSQLDVIYENLDALKETNPEWKEIFLKDKDGRELYPLAGVASSVYDPKVPIAEIKRPILIGDAELGQLTARVDLGPSIALQRQHLFELGVVFASLCLILLVSMIFLIETAVLIPVRNLSRASKALARRDFATPLPKATKDEIGALIETFAAMREARRSAEEELARSNEELEQFAYAASHDLREPLRMVGSYVTLIDRRYADTLDKDGREFLAFAKEGVLRMDQLIKDLLEYSRVGRVFEARSHFALQDVADEALQILALRVKETQACVELTEGFKSLPEVQGFRDELLRLMYNLIGNAVKYQPPDRKPLIVIDGHVDEDGFVVVAVKDNGIGIDKQYFDRIFQIFKRLHPRTEYEGSGIGLATCKKVVEHHGGRIWVESQPDQGSAFFFSLPQG